MPTIYSLLDNMLDTGLSEFEFWNMTIGEIERYADSYKRREEARLKELERIAAEESIQNGIYSSWVNLNENNEENECFKIGSKHFCFCNHSFNNS